ncbi:MAG: hypothetical protein AB2821_14555 [Candidatus Thiodiazotropha endolucinida]
MDNSATEAGAVYLFERTQGAWTQVAYLKASTIESYDRFGSGLAFSSDGEWLAVGAPDKQLPLSAFDDEQQNRFLLHCRCGLPFQIQRWSLATR